MRQTIVRHYRERVDDVMLRFLMRLRTEQGHAEQFLAAYRRDAAPELLHKNAR